MLALCTDTMLCHDNKQMREYLNEAKDHKVVQERVDESGQTLFFMNYPEMLLEKIVKEMLTK